MVQCQKASKRYRFPLDKENHTSYLVYKNRVAVDMRSKLILSQEVTTASLHDSQVFEDLMDEQTQVVFANSAYIGQDLTDGVRSEVMTRSVRNQPLTEDQIQLNHLRAPIRCRVEHVFAFIENSMNGSTFRGTTLIRAKFNGMITSLTYNLFRIGQVKKGKQAQREQCANFRKKDWLVLIDTIQSSEMNNLTLFAIQKKQFSRIWIY